MWMTNQKKLFKNVFKDIENKLACKNHVKRPQIEERKKTRITELHWRIECVIDG